MISEYRGRYVQAVWQRWPGRTYVVVG